MIRTFRVFHHHAKHVVVIAGEGPDFQKLILAAGSRANQKGQGGCRSLGCSREISYGVVTIMQSGHDDGQSDISRTSEMHQNSATPEGGVHETHAHCQTVWLGQDSRIFWSRTPKTANRRQSFILISGIGSPGLPCVLG